jgi:antitoxin ParD1/3/4
VRAGLRLLEEHEMKVEALRAALIEGEQSGASTSLDFEGFIARKRKGEKPAA